MKVAAIDCGTNTLRLLVADVDPRSGLLRQLVRRSTIVRLGQDVDRTGVFAAEALERTFSVLDEYVNLIGDHRVDTAKSGGAVRMVATSAARDVRNREEFVAGVRHRLGIEPDVVSGDEEARLGYVGATRGLDAEMTSPVVVLDIGGGSTELVTRADGDIHGQSLDVGSVRLTERHLHDDPPTADQVAAAAADVEAGLDSLRLPLGEVGTLVGVAGTTLTMAAMVLGLSSYDRDALHHARVRTPRLVSAVDTIVAMSVEERQALPFMHRDRADVIGAGAVVLKQVVQHLGVAEVVASAHDILDGIAWSLLDPE